MYKQDMYGSGKMAYKQMVIIEWYFKHESEIYQNIMKWWPLTQNSGYPIEHCTIVDFNLHLTFEELFKILQT